MKILNKLGLLKWWAGLNATQKLNTWQTVVIFVLFNSLVGMAVAFNNLRIEHKNDLNIEKAKTDQINQNWILYLQKSIETEKELYLKTQLLKDKINRHENNNVTP